jgi:hypothetical protein
MEESGGEGSLIEKWKGEEFEDALIERKVSENVHVEGDSYIAYFS